MEATTILTRGELRDVASAHAGLSGPSPAASTASGVVISDALTAAQKQLTESVSAAVRVEAVANAPVPSGGADDLLARGRQLAQSGQLGALNQMASALVNKGGKTADQRDEYAKEVRRYSNAQDDAAFNAFVADLVRYQKDLEGDTLSEDFFYRFYWYLVQLPLPKTAVTLTWKSASDTDASKMDARAIEQTKLINAVLNQRLIPWKSFFCSNLKSEALCTPDASLRSLATGSTAVLSTVAFTYDPPPAPPPKKKKRCKFGRGVWC